MNIGYRAGEACSSLKPTAVARAGRCVDRIDDATTAIFYSINSTQPGLAGVSLGNSLIKMVVAELQRMRLDLARHADKRSAREGRRVAPPRFRSRKDNRQERKAVLSRVRTEGEKRRGAPASPAPVAPSSSATSDTVS